MQNLPWDSSNSQRPKSLWTEDRMQEANSWDKEVMSAKNVITVMNDPPNLSVYKYFILKSITTKNNP